MRRKVLSVAVCVMMLYAQACSFSSAIANLAKWAPTVLTAFSGVVTIINPAAGSGLALADVAITKLFGVGGPVLTAISAYQASPGTTTLQSLTSALYAANTQLNTALADIPTNMNPGDVKAAEAGLLLLVTTLESFEAQLGIQPPATANAEHVARAVTLGVTPAKNLNDFKKKWNQIMQANGHQAQMLK